MVRALDEARPQRLRGRSGALAPAHLVGKPLPRRCAGPSSLRSCDMLDMFMHAGRLPHFLACLGLSAGLGRRAEGLLPVQAPAQKPAANARELAGPADDAVVDLVSSDDDDLEVAIAVGASCGAWCIHAAARLCGRAGPMPGARLAGSDHVTYPC